jgi:putative ABC transport system permease protein
VEGRTLEETDVTGSAPVIVLNRTAAKMLYPQTSALGRQVVVDMGSEELAPTAFEVVGIVEDHKHTSLSSPSSRSAMFFPYAQLPVRRMRLAVATHVDPASLVRPVQQAIWKLDRNIVLSNPQTMEEALAGSIAGSRVMATVVGLFAVVATVLATLGLYGVLTFFVTQRRHEIGIRIALGAGVRHVVRLVFNHGLLLVGIGSVLGTAGALGVTRLVQGMLFQIGTTDPLTFAGVTGLLLLVALAACLPPAWRALKVDPVEALRSQ